jgi:hypothetical protein
MEYVWQTNQFSSRGMILGPPRTSVTQSVMEQPFAVPLISVTYCNTQTPSVWPWQIQYHRGGLCNTGHNYHIKPLVADGEGYTQARMIPAHSADASDTVLSVYLNGSAGSCQYSIL